MSSAKLVHRDSLRPKLIALSVAACFGVSATHSLANPTGGTVASGSASFGGSGNTLTITNSANAIINWQSFSIGPNEITRFLQSSNSSAVLNRVVGSNGAIPQSKLDGLLQSVLANNPNSVAGRVFLLNPSGVVIGASGRIDVAGFVASSLNLSDADFLAGRMRFTDTPGAGTVSNAGTIDTSSAGPGGRVWLVGPDVQNSGVIRSPQGEIILAAGKSVELVSEGSPFITVNITADSERALNVGQLLADSGRIGMFGALVRQSGVAQANSAVVGANGEIRLVATSSATLDAGSVTSASGGAQGGSIGVSAPVVVQAGDIRADGNAGGKIQIDAGNFLQAGILSASGSAGAGGDIGVNAPHIIQTSAAVIAVDGNGGAGGTISVDASGAPDGLLFSSAKYSATGDKGGDIKLLGHDIVLLGASADASGVNGGGTILVGGDFRGNNRAVPNAVTTGVNFSTVLKADATQNGDGGKIVVWSDSDTRFYGTASARGGAQSGNGGSMEISSGGDHLAMFGFADAGAPNGTPGTLLLDPKNIIIDSNVPGTLGSFQLVDPHPGASEQFGTQIVTLPNQNVVVTDPNDSFAAIGAGAVYLFNSTTGGLISALTGSSLNDHVGANTISFTPSVIVLPGLGGNDLVTSPGWSNVAAIGAGAVTFGSGTTGVSGAVSATNSLIGTSANDQVGSGSVTVLANGNYVVASPAWSNGVNVAAGAVTFGNGATGTVGAVSITNSLVGATPNDNVGIRGIVELSNGNYVVSSPNWTNPGTLAAAAGAVTLVDKTGNIVATGTPGGTVSATNSLVGTALNDGVGFSVTPLNSGDYVVSSLFWNNGTATAAGAATFVNGTTGIFPGSASPGGAVTTANSLVGSTPGDHVGDSIIELTNGNYIVRSPEWTNLTGAVTLVDKAGNIIVGGIPTTPGARVSGTNSLVGSTPNDFVGGLVLPLSGGNYLVASQQWNNNAGAVTFGPATGVVGPVTAANSLVGSTANDQIGNGGVFTLATSTGVINYVVISPTWDGPGAAAPGPVDVGAVTFGDTTKGGVSGAITATNSLVGTIAGDQVGIRGVTLLSNGNFVVDSSNWNGGMGAVTFGSGATGVAGAVSATNSLVGSVAGDQVGGGSISQLSNGNYVVTSPQWNNAGAAAAGAVTLVDGTNGNINLTGTPGGAVSAANSLVGTAANDRVGGFGFVMPLLNGGFVVASPNWANGAATAAGAATLVGATGLVGPVSAANSLVGTNTNDEVGSGGVTPLFLLTGNYVVRSPNWNGGMGAATFGSGTAGVIGPVTTSNSLVGGTADNPTAQITGDHVGSDGVFALLDGNYLVASSQWSNPVTGATQVGAVTWVNGTNGNVFGLASRGATVSASNSLVGGTSNDRVGSTNCDCSDVRILPLPSGDFVVVSPNWTNPVTGASSASAVTFGSAGGIAGLVSPSNSLVGSAQNDSLGSGGIFPLTNGNFIVSSPSASNGGLLDAGLVHVVTPGTAGAGGGSASGLTFAANSSGDVTITPFAITKITNTGTALVLQANNDIRLNPGSDVVTSAGGLGGSLTLQAGRSILLNSSITTDNGNLALTANETAPNGVITAERDPGAAVITQAAGTTLNAGSGAITITLTNGLGRTGTQADNGAISLANVTTSGNLTVTNGGAAVGSDVLASGTLRGGALVKMTATGALGRATAPLEVATAALQAGAATGIYINTNSAAPAMVNVLALTNITSGDIVLNAHGGATTTSLVSNPGGNVTINSFSPLDIGGGITAGNSIFLSTGGSPSSAANDMSLAGLYTYNISTGAFDVTVGVGGALTLFTGSTPLVLTAPLFPNPLNITQFTFLKDTGSIGLGANTVIDATNKLAKTDTIPTIDELEKKGKDAKKKEAVACK